MKKIKRPFGLYWARPVGIGFQYFGDDVVWVWPWKRSDGHKYLSINFEAGFKALADIAYEWGRYDELCIQLEAKKRALELMKDYLQSFPEHDQGDFRIFYAYEKLTYPDTKLHYEGEENV